MRKAERIARMAGRTTYKDFREGFGGGISVRDSDADIKAALGMAQREVGALAVQVLETKYTSSLMHERAIRRAWDRHVRDGGAKLVAIEVALHRFGAALAIRRHAGARMIQHEIGEYAWMLGTRRERLDHAMRSCGSWLDGLSGEGEKAFLESLAVIRPRRRVA